MKPATCTLCGGGPMKASHSGRFQHHSLASPADGLCQRHVHALGLQHGTQAVRVLPWLMNDTATWPAWQTAWQEALGIRSSDVQLKCRGSTCADHSNRLQAHTNPGCSAHLCVVVQDLLAVLTANAGQLVAAKGDSRIKDIPAVDPYSAGLDASAQHGHGFWGVRAVGMGSSRSSP